MGGLRPSQCPRASERWPLAPAAWHQLWRPPPGGGTARAPNRNRLGVIEGGARPLARAPRVRPRVVPGFAPAGPWRLLTDGVRASLPAVLPHAGPWRQPSRRQATGPLL